jgi:lysophospholipase L1-like esterase
VWREATLLGGDGLHPNVAGYQQLAQSYLDAIRSRYEVVSLAGVTRSLSSPW